MKIDKAYFTLAEVRERWRASEADLVYVAENGDLRVSVRVFGVPLEVGSVEETAEGEWFAVPHAQTRYSGVLDLHAADAFRVFRDGRAMLTHFLAANGDYATVLNGSDAVEVRRDDLLVRKGERDRFEAESGFGTAPAAACPSAAASADCRAIWLGDELLRFGPIQAEVIRALHAARLAGDPWQSGKAILSLAGSRSLRMADVFKSKPGWRRLIESNGRGFYRLAVNLEAR